MTVSVIIPYYNPDCNPATDSLLIRAIKSATDNLTGVCDYEIIIVNDGSPADPPVDSLKNGNIKYIRCSHKRQGAARNTGIENATGQIITFLDADDCYFPGSLAPCIKTMQETGADLLGFGMKCLTDTTAEPRPSSQKPVFTTPVTGNHYMLKHNLPGTSCRYLISSSLIRNNNLRFMENAYIEDEDFNPRMMHFSQNYIETSFPVYAYCIRSGSTMTDVSEQMIETKTADTLKVLSSLIRFSKEHSLEPHDGLDRKISYLAMDHIRRTLRRKDWSTAVRQQITELKSMGLFPLRCHDGSIGFKLYSSLSRCRTGLFLLHLAETIYK